MAFPVDPIDVAVEAFYDSAWNDITGYVFDRSAASISMTRGRGNESGRCTPGRMTLELNNRDGRFSTWNRASPLYGKIGLNSLIRLSVTYGAVTYTRFVGRVLGWPPRWNANGTDIWVPIVAAGILEGLEQPSRPQQSALYRAMIGAAQGDIVPAEYWPLEEAAGATRFASAVGGLPAAGAIVGDAEVLPVPAGHDGIPGSLTSVLLPANAVIHLPVRPYTDTGLWVSQAALVLEDSFFSTPDYKIHLANGMIVTANTSVDGLQLVVEDAGGTIFNDITSDPIPAGAPLSLVVVLDNTGDVTFRVLDGLGNILSEIGTTGISYAMPRLIVVDNGTFAAGISHITLFTDAAFDIDVDAVEGARAASGWLAENADDRFTHLCAQARITSEVVGASSAQMGPERTVTRMQALRDCEDTDQGFILELRDELGLKFRTVSSKYNQVPVELDYASKHLSDPFEPEPDGFGVFNDREVRRYNGSFSRAVLEEGRLSIADPPDGIGPKEDTINVLAYDDDQLDDIANWRRHIGTWDAPRYSQVHVNLARNTSLIASVVPLDSGDYLRVNNLPSWVSDVPADLIVEGYTEVIRSHSWDIIFNTSPAGPFNVVGRWALLSHELRANINNSVTSIDVVNTDTANQPMLATAATDIGTGYGLTIGGEELQLTAVASPGSPLFVTAAASHADNASLSPAVPSVQAGDVLFLLAAIRNSGTGVPNTPSGYTRLNAFPASSNVQLFGKISAGSESSPTVSFTGGVAGATTSARIVRFRGFNAHDITQLVISSAWCLNTSAQNITYPGLAKPFAANSLILVIGWKQDDWTSVATLFGASEVFDDSSTLGDDQGIVMDRIIQGATAESVPSGVFTVTGGASAISRAAVVAIHDDYQTCTVTRGVNGTTAASHTAGDAVTETEPMRWGLL